MSGATGGIKCFIGFRVKEMRQKGVFRGMYGFGEEFARSQGAAGLRLYVEKENVVAKEVYSKLGMSETCYHMYETEFK